MTLNNLRALQTRTWITGLSTLVAATLVACGGGGTSDSSASASGSGAQTYSGTVSGLGSIVVNGVRFSTTGAETQDSDDPSQPYASSFKLGATVVVTGSVNGTEGQAASIEIVGGVRGQVSAADATAGTLTVAGQAIKVDANTVFDGEGDASFSLASIAAGFGASAIYVEVYGTADETGTILATRIEKKDPTALIFALKGFVVPGSITSTSFTLQIKRGNTLADQIAVNYSASDVLPTTRTLTDGIGVRVLTNTNPANATSITARKVLIKTDRHANGTLAKMHGVVKTISGTTWTVGDVTVDVSKSPALLGFASLSDVQAGTEVRIAGRYDNGVLTARVIESEDYEHDRDHGGVKLFGVASGVDSTARTFSVQGVTVTVPNGLSLPTDGSYVEVIATQINGVLTAVHISGSATAKPFEVFGLASCTNGASDLRTTFTLTLPLGSVSVDGSNALLDTDRGVTLTPSDTPKVCLVEVKGTATTVNGVKTITATKIEVKARRAPLI